MTREELKEVSDFLDYLQDKVEDVYAKETQIMIERFLQRMSKNTHSEINDD
ncbi:hypothetical protein PT168_08660 [Erysipelothrix rhusiopathiae]|nr:hypothetical protein [Erysipelothrix rhusiopathiae]